MKSLLLSLVFIVLFASCKEYASESGEVEVVAPVEEAKMAVSNMDMPSLKDDSQREMNLVANTQRQDVQLADQKIIREAELRFEVDDLDATYERIRTAVTKYTGIIQSDAEGKSDDQLYRNMSIRVPSANFDSFIADVRKGIGYFDRKEISARDVTEEYIDTEARLKAKKALETRYLELLRKANKVSEMLEIETELSKIREEIEAKEGALRYMQHRISMSSVGIEFYKKTAIQTGATVSYGGKMWNAIKSGFYGISTFFVGLLYLWPFIIILVVLFFFFRRRLRKKTI